MTEQLPIFTKNIELPPSAPLTLEDALLAIADAKRQILHEAEVTIKDGTPALGMRAGWMDAADWEFHLVPTPGGIAVVYLPKV